MGKNLLNKNKPIIFLFNLLIVDEKVENDNTIINYKMP